MACFGVGDFRTCQISWPARTVSLSSVTTFTFTHCSFVKAITRRRTMSRPPPKKLLSALFNTRFEPFSKPVNCTTFIATQNIASDDRHPLHIPTSNRLDNWNPQRLHWVIRTPVAVSKKRTIRSWVTRRFRDTFISELEKSGFNRWGEPLAASKNRRPLTGALAITLLRPALTAASEDVRDICSQILRKNILSRQRP
ncbi:hypothetical protein AUEXF2481DRAFT_645757 [Aureobasidium subglaciale EXF-2481]|uniref:Uncharacterized protein n=1 Tax=Aureobasidium subglaciale (strain EXF-2481) TaxID=1043005 RepID=A0A074ZD35_AURSE|nr:uncharacterized protein AUEXF2481DRAFT_645757 [Aureobasidium subglaciale EXF-2481]KEQ96576.1 hypothetical protein AUEXF2481DRAFT_645757 [Aureobasidium subglaciale EXF-2481]